MQPFVLSLITIFFYVLAWICEWRQLQQATRPSSTILLWLLLIGLLCHALVLHQQIDLPTGQNLSFLNLVSMAAWMVTTLFWLALLFRSIGLVLLFLLPLTMGAVFMALFHATVVMVQTAYNAQDLFHILLSILTFALACVAGIEALLLMMRDYLLHRSYQGWLTRYLPPLQSLEASLFRTIGIGFGLLTLLLVTSLYTFHAVIFLEPHLLQKTLLAFLAWLVFGVLCWGHAWLGWRGKRVTYATLLGLWLLFVIYYGSQWMLQ